MPEFPANFALLHVGEEQIRQQTIHLIESSSNLSLHATAIEMTISLIRHYVLRDNLISDDDLTIRLLGIRVANGLSVSINLLMSGYYQASAVHQRDILETSFLLNYFGLHLSQIVVWRTGDEKTHRDLFAPVIIRKALDDHYNHTTRKREEAYKLICRLAAHPHPAGFAMFRGPNGFHSCGPFFDPTALEATLSELAKEAVEVGEHFGEFFNRSSRLDYETQFAFYVAKVRWFAEFWGQPVDEVELSQLRAALNDIQD